MNGSLPTPVECALFQDVAPAALERIVRLAHQKRVATGALFVREGEAAEEFFILTEGRVAISQITPDGHRILLRLVAPGEAFGSGGAFGESVYWATRRQSSRPRRWPGVVWRCDSCSRLNPDWR